MGKESLRHYIQIHRPELTKEAKRVISDVIKTVPFQNSAVGSGQTNYAWRTSDAINVPQGVPLDHILETFFREAVQAYEKAICPLNLAQRENFQLLRYKRGQQYKLHTDAGAQFPRTVSMLYYINEDYTGGQLYFPTLDFAIKPAAGDLILFPSNFLYPHASLPVKKGTKYVVVSWAR